MIYIDKQSTNPWFNIAAEEAVINSTNEDVVMLWINEPSVVIGKHQNVYAEVNHKYILQNNIPVIRRISGGGTVYHDKGNLNYTIINTEENREKLINFEKFTDPIIKFFKSHGIIIHKYEKTNLGYNGQKVSGTAAHVHKNRVLNHGTLLYNTNIKTLIDIINTKSYSIEDKAVRSSVAKVVNLHDLVPDFKSIEDFKNSLFQFLIDYYSISEVRSLTNEEIEETKRLINEKYSKNSWNYGYSPKYIIKKDLNINNHKLTIQLEVKKGIIVDLHIKSDLLPNDINEKLRKLIVGLHHDPVTINESLNNLNIDLQYSEFSKHNLIELLTY